MSGCGNACCCCAIASFSSSSPLTTARTTTATHRWRRSVTTRAVCRSEPISALARFLVLCSMFFATSPDNDNRRFGAMARKLADIHWQSNNSIFDISNTEHVKRVHLLDRVTLLCPTPTLDGSPERYEFSKLFMVSRDAYEQCALRGDERQLGVCATPERQSSITLVFREFSPLPSAFTFRPGHSYYVITTSNGTLDGLNNTAQGGLCSTRNMRLKFDVLHTASAEEEKEAEDAEQQQKGDEAHGEEQADQRHKQTQNSDSRSSGGRHRHHHNSNGHHHNRHQKQQRHREKNGDDGNAPLDATQQLNAINEQQHESKQSAAPSAAAPDESPPPFLYVIHTVDTPLDEEEANTADGQHAAAAWGHGLYNDGDDDGDVGDEDGHVGGRQGRDRANAVAHQYASSSASSQWQFAALTTALLPVLCPFFLRRLLW